LSAGACAALGCVYLQESVLLLDVFVSTSPWCSWVSLVYKGLWFFWKSLFAVSSGVPEYVLSAGAYDAPGCLLSAGYCAAPECVLSARACVTPECVLSARSSAAPDYVLSARSSAAPDCVLSAGACAAPVDLDDSLTWEPLWVQEYVSKIQIFLRVFFYKTKSLIR
jgi:hypothetical protein